MLLICCQRKASKKYDPSQIDRERIDMVFGHDVSKVLLDHLYIVVDSLTYARLTTNRNFKNNYASLDIGLPDFKPLNGTTSTCYLRGHKHYIEILGPQNTYGEPIGKSGIGFSLRNKGEYFHLGVTPKLKRPGTPYLSMSETVHMPFGKNSATWFKAFYTPSEGTALQTWYAFYNPAFLDSLHQTEHHEYSREEFLKNSYSKKQLFQGIRSIEMTCTPKDYERIAQEMRHLGCALWEKNDKTLTIASGDVIITITPSNSIKFSRITHIRCVLNAVDTSVTQLGNLTITNKGTESIWNLENLYED
ncbi:DUF5829 family protein [Flagellimonas lutaonensis]|nr:DUF5829 family protein [Allomuricauda lutaonensis]